MKAQHIHRPEHELLLCCSRTKLNANLQQQICRLVSKNPDWDYLIQAAKKHRVLTLLHHNLKQSCPELIPSTIAKQLTGFTLHITQRNLQFSAQLFTILDLFQKHHIPIVPFKGPVLAVSVYGNLGFRPFGDLDVLIHTRHVKQSNDLLQQYGYLPELRLSSSQLSQYIKVEDNLNFKNESHNMFLELHWELSGRSLPQAFTLDIIKDHIEFVEFCGKKVCTIGPTALLVYLCIHGEKHNWETLEWICCLAELVNTRKDINWKQAWQLAEKLHCKNIVLLGLLLAHQLFDITLPQNLQNKASANVRVKQTGEELLSRLFGNNRNSRKQARFTHNHLYIRDNIFDQARHLIRLFVLPTKADWQILQLPNRLTWLYYFLRPLRICSQLFVAFAKKR